MSYKAKDLRDLCMTYNMEKGNEAQHTAQEKRKIYPFVLVSYSFVNCFDMRNRGDKGGRRTRRI